MSRRREQSYRLPLGLLLAVLSTCCSTAAAELPGEPAVTAEDRDHWSFRPLRRPPLPAVSDDAGFNNPIDVFVRARLAETSLTPLPCADRETLIRRLSFDLLGIPPAPEEVDRFVKDPAPTAYERLVDQYLASPHFGYRWAQHWLDLARFAETDGFEHDKVRRDAWRYRDWVIAAMNEDLGYDRFVQFQLAGDELGGNDPQAAIATAFCLSGPDMPDINSMPERKHNLLNEMTSTVGAALLGLQLECAQCHDHKYDPISQADFYRLRAVFAPAVQVTKNKSVSTLREFSGDRTSSQFLMIRGDWRRPGAQVEPAVPRIANPGGEPLRPVRGLQSSGFRAAFAQWLTREDHPLTARVIVNRLWQHHFGQGLSSTPSDFGQLGDEPFHPQLLDWLAQELVDQGWSLKRIHRLIVTSSTYRQASKFKAGAASRMAARRDLRSQLRDPGNHYLARYPRRRLSGEAIRDAMLVAAGALNTAAGGPGVRPPLPGELVQTLLRNQWQASPREADHYRRSIYVFARRNLRYPIFEAFDRPDGNASCPRRPASTTAPQSLLMLNSEFSLLMARRLAGRVLGGSTSGERAQIARAFRYALGRRPSADEREFLQQFLSRQTGELRQEGRSPQQLALPLPCPAPLDPYRAAAFTDLCLALFNSNEFLYID